jgi:hypothetical protein
LDRRDANNRRSKAQVREFRRRLGDLAGDREADGHQEEVGGVVAIDLVAQHHAFVALGHREHVCF